MTAITFDDMMAESLCKDPAWAVDLLNSVLKDGDPAELLIALRQISKAFGGVSTVAKQAGVSANTLLTSNNTNHLQCGP